AGGNQAAAADALKKAIRLDPGFLDAHVALAGLEVKRGSFDEALAIARTLQRQQAKSPAGHMLEGDILMAQRKAAPALAAYEKAAGLGDSEPLMIKLHSALARAGKGKDADARLAAWLKNNP